MNIIIQPLRLEYITQWDCYQCIRRSWVIDILNINGRSLFYIDDFHTITILFMRIK